MKFKDECPFDSFDAVIRKLLEIAIGLEVDHAGRLQIRSRLCRPAPVRRVYDVHPGLFA
jgi:hypothetical protein